MSGAIGLQGGKEFSAACRDLDLAVLATAPLGPVVVLAAAAAPGADYDRAAANGVRHLRRLVDDDVAAVPDPRDDLEGALQVLGSAAMVVLPGGSPARLHEVLVGTAVGEVVREQWEAGATLSGSSAGAMVLTERTWLPERDRVVEGLGLVEGIVRPHHAGDDVRRFDGDTGLLRWGLPECGGVVVQGGSVRAVGRPGVVVGRDDDVVALGSDDVALATLLR